MTGVRILDVINKTTPFFEKRGVESPRLTIELMLAHLLHKKRLELYLDFERELDEATVAQLREMVRRRADGEPLQYILGETEFFGLKFMVDRRVLIPRPETELLVDTVLERLKSEIRNPKSEITIVDLGTGSGCIAVAIAKNLPAAAVCAVDASAEALEVARQNAQRHGVEKNIRFFHGDLLNVLPDSLKADVIVSNPPYIATGELAKLPREVKDFEPVQALTAGVDGLEVYRRIANDARRFLSPTGFVALELGAGQRVAVEVLLSQGGYRIAGVEKDLQGHERVIVAQAQVV